MITAYTTAAILQHFDHHREVIIEMHGSDYVSTVVPSQHADRANLHPVADCSQSLMPAECI